MIFRVALLTLILSSPVIADTFDDMFGSGNSSTSYGSSFNSMFGSGNSSTSYGSSFNSMFGSGAANNNGFFRYNRNLGNNSQNYPYSDNSKNNPYANSYLNNKNAFNEKAKLLERENYFSFSGSKRNWNKELNKLKPNRAYQVGFNHTYKTEKLGRPSNVRAKLELKNQIEININKG